MRVSFLRNGQVPVHALCSVAVDLRIHEVVDVPNWVVGAWLPEVVVTR